jgi:ABC-type uncharacterized transport system involved in gliding motility auxiliary subunit
MKLLTPHLKYLKYLVWLSPMLITAGLVAGLLSGLWLPVPLGLISAGIVVLVVWLLVMMRLGTEAAPGFWQRRSTQVGTNALIATLSMLVILGLLNFLAVRYTGRLDLTENQLFTLAPQTQQVVSGLEQPLKVWVFTSEITPRDRELLESYRRQSSQFSFEIVDPTAQPTVAQQFEVKNAGDVFVEVPPARKQFVQTLNAQERLSEVKLTNTIERVLSGRTIPVYFLQGHGERPLDEGRGAITQAVKSLGDKNYVVKPLNLAEARDFPTDARVVVVAGPRKPLLAPEVAAIESFVSRGGNLLLLIDPNTDPNVKPLLAPWGVLLDERIVIDASGTGQQIGLGPADALVTQYGNHPIAQEFRNVPSFYSLARPVDVDAKPGVTNTPFLYTSDRAWAESDFKTRPLSFDPKVDRQGPFTLGIALSRAVTPPVAASPSPTPTATPTAAPSPTPQPTSSPTPASPIGTSKESRLVVIGNSTFMTDGAFGQVINGDVFVNSVGWLSQQDQPALSISPKDPKNRRITLSNEQSALLGWFALGILPLLGFVTAGVIWWRRR